MTDEQEEWEVGFRTEWMKEIQKLIAFTHTSPFRVVATEINEAIDKILRKHFKDPRARTIKSLLLIYMLGQHIEDWVKPKDAPGAWAYRKLFDIIAHESSLGQLILEHAAAEGVDHTNSMVQAVIKKYIRRLHIVQPPKAPEPPPKSA